MMSSFLVRLNGAAMFKSIPDNACCAVERLGERAKELKYARCEADSINFLLGVTAKISSPPTASS